MPHFERNMDTKSLKTRVFVAAWLWLIALIAMLFSYRQLPFWAKIAGTAALAIFAPAGLGALIYRRNRGSTKGD